MGFAMSTERVKDFIETLVGNPEKKISLHKQFNSPFQFFSSDDIEMLHAMMYNTKCSGSGGSGWDTVDKGESKFSDRTQAKTCQDCKTKMIFYHEDVCSECGSTNLKYPKDSRWGISSESHLKYFDELAGYRVALLEPETYSSDCRKFRLRSWFIETKNEYLTTYMKYQFDSPKSNHVNFMPLQRDFYRSSPCLHLDAWISLDGNHEIVYYDVENKTPEVVPEKYAKFTTEEIMRKKNFGKNRGITSRN